MSNLRVYIISVIIGYTMAAPVFETLDNGELREIDTIGEDSPELTLTARDEEKDHRPREIIFEIIETKDAAQMKDVLVIDEIVDASVFDNDDMELAETHIFRPLFRYRAQLEKRQRLGHARY